MQGGFHGNALQTSCYEGHIKVVKVLLDKDADVNPQGGYYSNALRAACYRGYNFEVVKLYEAWQGSKALLRH